MKYNERRKIYPYYHVSANLEAVFDCFVKKSPLKCLVSNDNVNNVYLIMSFSMLRSLLLQFSSRQFFNLTCYWLKRAKEIIETNQRGCNKKVIIWLRCASRPY